MLVAQQDSLALPGHGEAGALVGAGPPCRPWDAVAGAPSSRQWKESRLQKEKTSSPQTGTGTERTESWGLLSRAPSKPHCTLSYSELGFVFGNPYTPGGAGARQVPPCRPCVRAPPAEPGTHARLASCVWPRPRGHLPLTPETLLLAHLCASRPRSAPNPSRGHGSHTGQPWLDHDGPGNRQRCWSIPKAPEAVRGYDV